MIIQTRKLRGDSFTANDTIEVSLINEGIVPINLVHTILMVSGAEVTHGGGGKPENYLHYKAVERDADEDGVIDYSLTEMNLVQSEKGIAIIKVRVHCVTQQFIDDNNELIDSLPDDIDPEQLPPTEFIEVESGEITLEWTDDTFV